MCCPPLGPRAVCWCDHVHALPLLMLTSMRVLSVLLVLLQVQHPRHGRARGLGPHRGGHDARTRCCGRGAGVAGPGACTL